MIIDYRKLIPSEITDEFAYRLSDFLYDLVSTFDCMHITKVIRYEKNIINGKPKPKADSTKSKSGVLS